MSVPPSLHRSRRRPRSKCGSLSPQHATSAAATVSTISHYSLKRLLLLLVSFITTAPKQQQQRTVSAAALVSTMTSYGIPFTAQPRRCFIQHHLSPRRRLRDCRHDQQQTILSGRSRSSSLSSTQQHQDIDTTAASSKSKLLNGAALPDDLTSLTVKELRQLVKQQQQQQNSSSSPPERGLMSRLKRKQDLISHLQLVSSLSQQPHETNNIVNGDESTSSISSTSTISEVIILPEDDDTTQIPPLSPINNGVAVAVVAAAAATVDTSRRRGAAKMKKKLPLNMPPTHHPVPPPPKLEENDSEQGQQRQLDGSSSSSTTTTTRAIMTTTMMMSPKDAIFEKVYQRYPPLRQAAAVLAINNIPSDTTEDMRQWYHPVFSNLWTSSTTAAPKEQSKDESKDSETNGTDDKAASNNNNFNLVSSDMDIVFVGTASCTPGVTRGVSCTALRLNWRRKSTIYKNGGHMQQQIDNFQGGTWLFDVGECTQLQVQRTPSIRPSKIIKIFLTHAHGDHSFGLPGLLCLMGRQEQREDSPPVEIYGPEGLRMWLRVAIRYSVSRICPPYRVHEIMNVPMAPEWDFSQRTRRFYYKGNTNNQARGGRRHVQQQPGQRQTTTSSSSSWANPRGLAGDDPINWISQANNMQLEASALYGEIEGGRQIHPIYNHPLSSDGAPVWEVEDEEDVKVYAAPMSHGIPCLGYVVEELPRPGRLRNDIVEPVVQRNAKALQAAGFPIPMKAMAVIKNLPPGSAFTFPDGTIVTQQEAVEPPRRGRKVVICGDTCDSRALDKLAQDATVVVHEATNAFLQGVDKKKNANFHEVTRDAIIHGHSTPQIAGKFARRVNAGLLVMNHFSARYKGDVSVDSLSIMMRIEEQAMKASALNETQVVAAWDLMVLPIPQL